MRNETIKIGVSTAGMNAMKGMFSLLPKDFSTTAMIAQYIDVHSDNNWIKLSNDKSNILYEKQMKKKKNE